MKKLPAAILAAAIVAASSFACRPPRPNLAPRPEKLGFPLMEESSIAFAGTISGPIRIRYGVAYFSTDEGLLYSVDALSRRVLWTFRADRPILVPPEIGDEAILVRDEGNTIYRLDEGGRLVFKATPADPVTSPVRERLGLVYFGCANGRVAALDPLNGGRTAWEFRTGAAVRAGPVFSGDMVVFGFDDGRVRAFKAGGEVLWTFAARGAVLVDPAIADGRVYFGTEERCFYCLSASTGRRKWVSRAAGAPAHPPLAVGKRVVFAGSDSVTYCVARGNGEIVWWRPVTARVVHAPSIADGTVLVSGLSPELSGFDLRSGLPVGSYRAESDLEAGARWTTPYVLVAEADPESSGGKLAFLKRDRRPVQVIGPPDGVRR
jgi:outer membrane protein assembly factor BamB